MLFHLFIFLTAWGIVAKRKMQSIIQIPNNIRILLWNKHIMLFLWNIISFWLSFDKKKWAWRIMLKLTAEGRTPPSAVYKASFPTGIPIPWAHTIDCHKLPMLCMWEWNHARVIQRKIWWKTIQKSNLSVSYLKSNDIYARFIKNNWQSKFSFNLLDSQDPLAPESAPHLWQQ